MSRPRRKTPRTRVQTAGLLAASILLLSTGCSRDPATTTQPATPPAISPRATVEEMIRLRDQRLYTELQTLVVPQRSAEAVKTLMAVDAFLDANHRLGTWVRDNVGLGIAQSVDMAELGQNLGVFSRGVELLDERIAGDRAEVYYTIGKRMPVPVARLRLVLGSWRYDPEGGYSENLPEGFREMARGLDRALEELTRGRPSANAIRDDPAQLAHSIQRHLTAGVALLSKARAEAENDEP